MRLKVSAEACVVNMRWDVSARYGIAHPPHVGGAAIVVESTTRKLALILWELIHSMVCVKVIFQSLSLAAGQTGLLSGESMSASKSRSVGACTNAICFFILAVAYAGTARAEQQLSVRPVERWSGIFADRRVEFNYVVAAEEPFQGRLEWAFSVGPRTIARVERAVDAAPRRPVRVAVPLRMPHVKQGVILQARLVVSVHQNNAVGKAVEHEKRIWIFPDDPLTDRSEWLENLKITLFDPEEKTTSIFEEANIPFKVARNVASLEELREGLVVVGEGASLEDYRDLPETMLRLASSGLPVLCLALSEGAVEISATSDRLRIRPRAISLRRRDVIAELDKHLDAVAWPHCKMAVGALALRIEADRVLAEVSQGGRTWPWVEVDYQKKDGRLLVCGFGVIEHWESGPTPRFLLVCMFERLTKKTN